MSLEVIGVGGQMQNGKDTVADYIAAKIRCLEEPWDRGAFAAGVKDVFCDTFGVDRDFVEEWKIKDEIPSGFDMTVRKSLQFIGDGFRQIKGLVWVEKPFRNRNSPVIISDVRYINELEKVSSVGGINILVWRPDKENDDPNGSEAQIKQIVDYWKSTDVDGDTHDHLQTVMAKNCCDHGLQAGAEFVDIFLRNLEGVDELLEKVNQIVLPYIQERYNDTRIFNTVGTGAA